MKKDTRTLMQAALIFGGVGLVTALGITGRSAGAGWDRLGICAGVAAGASGALAWRLVFHQSRAYRFRSGALAGIFTGLFSYPLCWYLAAALTYYSGQTDSFGHRMIDPRKASAIKGLWELSLLSALLTGWITIPAAALTGGILAAVQARKGNTGGV